MLERYRDNTQMGYITGYNPLEKSFPFPFSYYFSQASAFWGWATWRRTWQEYDEHLSSWPEVKAAGLLHLLFPNKRVVSYWTKVFDAMYEEKVPGTWDYQLVYSCWTRNCLSIVPSRNLVQYIGFGPQAEYTKTADPDLKLSSRAMSFPLQHPPAITPWPAYAMEIQDRFFGQSLIYKIRRKLLLSLFLSLGSLKYISLKRDGFSPGFISVFLWWTFYAFRYFVSVAEWMRRGSRYEAHWQNLVIAPVGEGLGYRKLKLRPSNGIDCLRDEKHPWKETLHRIAEREGAGSRKIDAAIP